MIAPVAAWKRIIPNDPTIAAINATFISWKFPKMMDAGVNTDPNPSPSEKP